MKHNGNGDTSCNWCTRKNPQRLIKGLNDLEISVQAKTIYITTLLRSVRIVPGFLRSAVTQTPLKNHRLTPV